LHFACSVRVASPRGDREAFFEAGDGLIAAAKFSQSLSGHLIGRDVVGVFLDESSELGEAAAGIALAQVFHGEAVAGERIVGVALEDFGECCDLVHGLMVRSAGCGWQVAKARALGI